MHILVSKFRFESFGYYWAGSLLSTVHYPELLDNIQRDEF